MCDYKYDLKLYRIRKEREDCYLTINKYGRIIELNEVSYQFLEAMKKFNNINDMVDYLSKIYNINSNEIIDDVLDFINQMELCGIIEKKA